MLRERKPRYRFVIKPVLGAARAGPARYRCRVEEINATIISLLARDGRMSFTELARRTGLSVSAAQQRVRRLERARRDQGVRAVISAEEIGLPLTAFVSIKAFDPAAPDDAPRAARASDRDRGLPQRGRGRELHTQGPGGDSPRELEDLLQEIRAAANVSTRTTIVLSTPFENRPPHV